MAKLKIKKKKNFVSFFGENAYKILFVPREGIKHTLIINNIKNTWGKYGGNIEKRTQNTKPNWHLISGVSMCKDTDFLRHGKNFFFGSRHDLFPHRDGRVPETPVQSV